MAYPQRLILTSSGSDDWLRSARFALEEDETITTEQNFLDRWTARDATNALESIEIISHSVSEPESQRNCLKVRDWTLDEQAFKGIAASVQTLVARRNAKPDVFIFGCLTAEGSVACAALSAMEQALGLPVYGTTRVCGLYDLENGAAGVKVGVKRDEPALWTRPTVTRTRRAAYAVNAMTLEAAGARLRDISHVRDDLGGNLPPRIAELLRELLDVLDPVTVFEFPGMLVLPTRSVPYATNDERGQIDSLYGNRLVRLIREFRSRRRVEYLFAVSSLRRPDVASAFARHAR